MICKTTSIRFALSFFYYHRRPSHFLMSFSFKLHCVQRCTKISLTTISDCILSMKTDFNLLQQVDRRLFIVKHPLPYYLLANWTSIKKRKTPLILRFTILELFYTEKRNLSEIQLRNHPWGTHCLPRTALGAENTQWIKKNSSL